MKLLSSFYKRFLMLLFVLFLGAGTASAYSFSAVSPSGHTLYYQIIVASNNCRLTCPAFEWTGYEKPEGTVVIPNVVVYNGTTYVVTVIDSWAFYGCVGMTSVVLPNQLVTISSSAFEDCTSLASITIPSSVTSIFGNPFIGTAWYNNHADGYLCLDGCCLGYKGEVSGSLVIPSGTRLLANHAFSGCSGFTGTLSIPNTLTSIPSSAFENCTGLTGSIVIPNSVKSIGNSAFSGCVHFSGPLFLGDSLVSIGSSAFAGCHNLSGSLTIPNTLVSIGGYAFERCHNLTGALIFPESMESIGQMAFAGCWVLTGPLVIPNPSTSLADYAFRECQGLVSADIACTTISEQCFFMCYDLTSVVLQNTVHTVEDGAFALCTSLSNLVMSNSVTFIGPTAFSDCALTSISIPSTVTYIGAEAFSATSWYNNQPDGVLYVDDCCLGYKNENGSGKPTGTLTIPDNTRLIAQYAFSECDGLTSLSLPASLKYINGNAFRYCSNIASMYSYAFAPPVLTGNPFSSISSSIPVYVPDVSVSSYTSASGWSYFTNYNGFATNSFEITVAANPEAGGTVTGGGRYYANANCTLSATSNPGYSFLYWKKNGITVSTNATYSFTVTGNDNFEAFFERHSHTIIASVDPVNGGSINGVGTYLYGDPCLLKAQSNAGYSFLYWTENGEVVSTYPSYYFTVTSDRNLLAHFGEPTSNSHEYVDLGLPNGTLWATCNVGADQPEGYGDHFAWGETYPKDYYDWGTYAYCNGSRTTLTKYCSQSYYGDNGFTDNLTILRPGDDAATANWGRDWRMPTHEEWQELYDNTTQVMTTQNGVAGVLFTASNGNSVFIPASGYYKKNAIQGEGGFCFYWSSSLYTSSSYQAWLFEGYSNLVLTREYRCYGCCVRPVRSLVQDIVQTIPLTPGWNWVSFNVEVTMDDVKAAVRAANPGATPVIKSKGNGQTSFNGAIWVGALKTLDLSQMYEIKVANACTVTLEGIPVNPADHPATIKNGVNWIAYPLDETMSVATAFEGFPATGDNVKSKDGGQATWNGVMWLGALKNLVPGVGYLYISKAEGDKTLTF